MKSVFGILSSGVASMALFGMISSGGPLPAVAEGADALSQVLNPIVAAAPAGAAEGEGIAPGGPGGGAPAVGAAVVAGGPAVAGGPVGGPEVIVGGPAIVEGGPIIEGPPPGPPLLHHFMYVAQRRYYGGVHEHKMELMLFGDHSFKFIMPQREDWGGRRGYRGHGHEEVCDDTGWTTGTWELIEDELCMTFADGFSRHGLFTVGETGPLLRYDGIRWNDILAIPAGPVGEAGPVGPIPE